MKPEFISAKKEGSFALLTITKRLPHIIDQIMINNALDAGQIRELERLRAEIPYERLKGFNDKNGFYEMWSDILRSHTRNWIEEPFMFAEFYLYRRITEAITDALLKTGTGIMPRI